MRGQPPQAGSAHWFVPPAASATVFGTLLVVLLRGFVVEDADDHTLARSVQMPPTSALNTPDHYAALASHAFGLRLGADVRLSMAQLPGSARVVAWLASQSPVVLHAPVELLPAMIGGIEVVTLLLVACLAIDTHRVPTILLSAAALAASYPAGVPDVALSLLTVVCTVRGARQAEPVPLVAGGLFAVLAALSSFHLAGLAVVWPFVARSVITVADNEGLRQPSLLRAVLVLLGLWQAVELVLRFAMDASSTPPLFFFSLPSPVDRCVQGLASSYDAAVDPGLWDNEPHLGNSAMTYQLLFVRFALGTRSSTTVFNLLPPAMTAVLVTTVETRHGFTYGELAAVVMLTRTLFGRGGTQLAHIFVAFAAAPALFLHLDHGLLFYGAIAVLVPLHHAYRIAWLEVGSMPQPNMAFYGGSILCLIVALLTLQVVRSMVVNARARRAIFRHCHGLEFFHGRQLKAAKKKKD